MSAFDFLMNPALPRPDVTAGDAARIARAHWGAEGEIRELGSNQDRNFLLDDGSRRVVLKVSNPVFGLEEARAQNLAAAAVAESGLRAPRSLPSLNGSDAETVEAGGASLVARLLEFVEGEPITGTGPFTEGQAAALGELSARVAVALGGIDHPGAAQLTQWNLRVAGEVVDLLATHVPDSGRRAHVLQVTADALARLVPVREDLREQVIHGDLTDDNAVLDPATGAFTGVIDFGDVARSWTVAELAVTCAAVLHHNPRDPLIVLETIAAFHRVLPLTPEEQTALWPLVQLRAAVLVVSGEHQVGLDSGNDYADANRRHEWRGFVTAAALDAAALTALIRWRLGERSAPADLVPGTVPMLDASGFASLDLSTTSAALDGGAWLEPGVEERLRAATAPCVVPWGVPRLTRARVRSAGGVETVPLFAEVCGSGPVVAPWAGEVRHEGGAVVLASASGEVWVTGLDAIAGRGPVEAGSVLGTLPPHPASMTVQLSRLDGVRPPAFVAPARAEVWKEVCPDPSALLGRPLAAVEPDLLALRDRSFALVQEHYYADPPRIERGWREHLVDTDAQIYVDMVNNVATTGHAHPRLVAAVARQWGLLNTNSRFHYGAVAEFSARLAELAPDPLDTVFLVNSGSEAVDLALRLATTATGRPNVVTMREAYHGWTMGSDAVSSSIADNPQALETRPDWVRLIDAPHRVGADVSLASLDAALDISTAGFIAEAIFGNGGGVLLPDGYLRAAYERVRAAGGLCIADEVQVGYGRLGSHFWGFEQQGVVPDILTMAKAMGNGHPLGAVITSRAIADAFAAEGSMFSSAGGSPVSSVVGLTVLDIMRDEDLVENARVVGAHLAARLSELGYPVHGMGLYLGVELPSAALATAVCEALRHEGVVMQPTGDHKNVLKIKPPLVVTEESADYFADALERVLGELA